MELNVGERVLLLSLLPPAEGDFLFLRLIRKFREQLSFSEEEAADIQIQRSPEKITWNPEKDRMKEIEIGTAVSSYISKSIRNAPLLKEEYLDFYSRFVEDA